MEEVTRRQVLRGAGLLAAVGAVSLATAGQAWSWSATGSVAGTGSGLDPSWVWDDAADPLVASLLDRGDVATVNNLLTLWSHKADPVPAGLPDDVAAFLASARQLPSWADTGKLALAADFNKRRGLYLGVLYGMGSGMMSCLIPHEARAVYYSRGGANMRDRIAKTAKLGYDIGALDAYQPNGSMVVTAVKTRLVHAAVRHLLPQSPYWKPTADQTVPISQRDLLVTWHSLATFTRRKLREWKVPVTTAEADAYLHLWQVSAHLLGIRDEYIPATWADADAQSPQVLDPVLGPTSEGLKLATILLNLGSQIDGGFTTRPMLESMTRYTLGGTYADWLAIPRNPGLDEFVAAGWPASIAFREGTMFFPFAPDGYYAFDEFLRQGALYYLSSGQRIDITIPDGNRTSF